MNWTHTPPTEPGFYAYAREYISPETGMTKYADPHTMRIVVNAHGKLVAQINRGTYTQPHQVIGLWLKLPELPKLAAK